MDYYILEKKMEFMDSIKDYDGYSPHPEAIKIFKNPFFDEQGSDAFENREQVPKLPG